MTQLELAKAIGCHDSTLRRMSARRRQQWLAMAAVGKTITWFDVVELLTFEVESFNAVKPAGENIALTFDGSGVAVYHMDGLFEVIKSFWASDVEELTSALQYVQGLNK